MEMVTQKVVGWRGRLALGTEWAGMKDRPLSDQLR